MSWRITPTQPVPVDPVFNNVSLLLHGNGTNGSTTITDSSPSPKTVTAAGNAQISTAIADPFGDSSRGVLAFDGNGDYLAIPDSTDWNLPNDFTVEAWVYLTAYSASYLGGFGVAVVSQFSSRYSVLAVPFLAVVIGNEKHSASAISNTLRLIGIIGGLVIFLNYSKS